MSVKHLLMGFKLPNSVQYNLISEDDMIGEFEIYPFERGLGHTVGNMLRRTLLSSIQGYAVAAMRIAVYDDAGGHKYISNGFENIPGLQEDTIDIIDAIKRLKFKFSDENTIQYTLRGEFKGTGNCTAEIFDAPEVEILNKNTSIFTASSKVELSIELDVELGRGYLPSDEIAANVKEKGTIALDVIFSPILNVKLQVENLRIGYRNDYEKVLLTIKTDGELLPSEALARAAKIIKDHLTPLINFNENIIDRDEGKEQELAELKKLLELSIDELELSSRSYNCLRAANIRNIYELVALSEREIQTLPNFGAKSMDEIKQKLQEIGMTLGMDIPEMLDVRK